MYGSNMKESKQLVSENSNLHKQTRNRRNKIFAAVTLACFVLIIGLGQVLIVHTKEMTIAPKFTGWVQQVTKIPVLLPSAWQPIKEIDKYMENIKDIPTPLPTSDDNKNDDPKSDLLKYSFFVDRTPDSYGISIYSVINPVPVSQSVFYEPKNTPFGYRQLESVSAEKITQETPPFKYEYDTPNDATKFILAPGVTAFKDSIGAALWWQQGDWIFECSGGVPSSLNGLKELASAWTNSPMPGKGHILFVNGNMSHVWVTWDYNGIRYKYSNNGGDAGAWLIKLLHSFTDSKNLAASLPNMSNIINGIQQVTHNIPVRLPLGIEAFAEYNRKAFNAKAVIPEDTANGTNGNVHKQGQYYFEVSRTEDGYGITAYTAKNPVAINDAEADLRENGPKFSEREVGSFGAYKIKDEKLVPKWSVSNGSDTKPFTLTPGVTAYKSIQYNSVSWAQGNWIFDYTDAYGDPAAYESSLKYLNKLAAKWATNPFIVKGTGHVQITAVLRDSFETRITWYEDGISYWFTTYSDNVEETIDILSSFRQSK